MGGIKVPQELSTLCDSWHQDLAHYASSSEELARELLMAPRDREKAKLGRFLDKLLSGRYATMEDARRPGRRGAEVALAAPGQRVGQVAPFDSAMMIPIVGTMKCILNLQQESLFARSTGCDDTIEMQARGALETPQTSQDDTEA